MAYKSDDTVLKEKSTSREFQFLRLSHLGTTGFCKCAKIRPSQRKKWEYINRVLLLPAPFISFPVGLHMYCLQSTAVSDSVFGTLVFSLLALLVTCVSRISSKNVGGRRAASDPKSRGPVLIKVAGNIYKTYNSQPT